MRCSGESAYELARRLLLRSLLVLKQGTRSSGFWITPHKVAKINKVSGRAIGRFIHMLLSELEKEGLVQGMNTGSRRYSKKYYVKLDNVDKCIEYLRRTKYL